MSNRNKIENKAKEIFDKLDADGYSTVRSGYFPTKLVVHLSGEGFAPDEVGAVGRALIRMGNEKEAMLAENGKADQKGVLIAALKDLMESFASKCGDGENPEWTPSYDKADRLIRDIEQGNGISRHRTA